MSSAMFARMSATAASGMTSFRPRITCGVAGILQMKDELTDLARRSGQPGGMDDLNYFLARPQVRKKTPQVLWLEGQLPKIESPDAAVLLYEHHVGGYGIRIFATDDTTGRRTLVSAPSLRVCFALSACQSLLERGAQIILISFRHEDPQVDAGLEQLLQGKGYSCRWASREREITGYLRLETTYDATMARLGNKTRSHLRYYRRRVEKELGAEFVRDVKISREDFIAMNRISAYAVTEEVAGWRYDLLEKLSSPLLYGMRDRDGRWLSLIGGRHYDRNMELFWQMNRDDMPSLSLGTAMRAFLIEHEVLCGTQRLYIEGGTTHSMSHAFLPEKVTDLIVIRQTPVAPLLPGLMKRFLHPDNMLLHVLDDRALVWRTVNRP